MRQLRLGIVNAKHESCSQLLWAVGFDSWVTRLMFRGSVFCTNAGPLLLDEKGGGVGRRTGSLASAPDGPKSGQIPWSLHSSVMCLWVHAVFTGGEAMSGTTFGHICKS